MGALVAGAGGKKLIEFVLGRVEKPILIMWNLWMFILHHIWILS